MHRPDLALQRRPSVRFVTRGRAVPGGKVGRVMRLARSVIFTLVLVVLAAACQVDADVVVQMDDDGSGTVTVMVTLDPEAAARIPDLADQLQVDDLEAVGWRVDGPSTVEGGALQITATRAFETPGQGAQVLTELTGPEGILQDVELTRSREFARTTFAFRADADATEGVASLADEALAGVLGGDGFGGQLEQIEADTGKPADEQVDLTLQVQLPGAGETWAIESGAPAEELAVDHRELRPAPLALVGGALICALVGFGLLIGRTIGAVRRRGKARAVAAPPPRPDDVPEGAVRADAIPWAGSSPADADRAAVAVATATRTDAEPVDEIDDIEEVEEATGRKLALVVLDVTGIVLTTGRETVDLLTTFARQRGGSLDRAAVEPSWELAAEGRLTVGELWASLGLTDDPGDLSDEFLALHRVRPGVRELLERLQRRELPVAGVADDIAEWSRKLRTTHKLDHLTRAWIVSGDVGERLPGGAVLGRVIQVTGTEARNALLISDRVGHLDAARSFGFAGALYVPNGEAVPAGVTYPLVRDFDALVP